jgi:DNA-directed RNA polymerase subunit RPC12/RpoP
MQTQCKQCAETVSMPFFGSGYVRCPRCGSGVKIKKNPGCQLVGGIIGGLIVVSCCVWSGQGSNVGGGVANPSQTDDPMGPCEACACYGNQDLCMPSADYECPIVEHINGDLFTVVIQNAPKEAFRCTVRVPSKGDARVVNFEAD